MELLKLKYPSSTLGSFEVVATQDIKSSAKCTTCAACAACITCIFLPAIIGVFLGGALSGSLGTQLNAPS